jgi:hypothetical protein
MKQKSKHGSNWLRDTKGKVQVSLYFTPEQVEKLDCIAARERRKRTAVVMGFVLDALEKVKTK